MEKSNQQEVKYTIAALTENYPGVLHRITSVFTRRKINVESLSVAETGVGGISRFTIVVKATFDTIKKVEAQLQKIVEVIDLHAYPIEDLIYKELAFYRISTSNKSILEEVHRVARDTNSKVEEVSKDHLVIIKVGLEEEIVSLYHKLHNLGLDEFVRSGMIAIGKHQQLVS